MATIAIAAQESQRVPVPQRVVGIDPGLNVTGYAVVEPSPRGPYVVEAGVIRPRSALGGIGPRLLWIHQGIVDVLDAFPPGSIALEQVHSHVSFPRTAILMAHARARSCWRRRSGRHRSSATPPPGSKRR